MAENKSDDTLADQFDRAHRHRLQNRTLDHVWQLAYGDDYPAEVMPSAFYSLSALGRLVQGLGPMEGRTLVDLGCGHGLAGLWVAKQLGMNLIGIDQSPGGISLASAHAADMGLTDRAKFQVGDVTSTGLADASCDAAISLDVLVFVEDKAAAIREIARILKIGGRFGFTTWEHAGYFGTTEIATIQ
jgi:SAM-dependent methyltransferase